MCRDLQRYTTNNYCDTICNQLNSYNAGVFCDINSELTTSLNLTRSVTLRCWLSVNTLLTTSPLNTDNTLLMKLDLPAPIWPNNSMRGHFTAGCDDSKLLIPDRSASWVWKVDLFSILWLLTNDVTNNEIFIPQINK